MKSILSFLAPLVISTIMFSGNALGAPVTYNFTATDFQSGLGSPVPYSTLSGNFTLDGSTVTQIDLTIGTHTYTAGEVGYKDYSNGYVVVGGILNGVDAVTSQTDDFWINFNTDTNTFLRFAYSTSQTNDNFTTATGTITVSPVPLPATAWLFGSGLIGLIGIALKR